MFAKINHVAITSDYYAVNAKFYEALFGMKTSGKGRPARAVPVGDGQIGLNNIPRREGRRSGLDHFGFEVESIDVALSRMQKFDPKLEAVKRPSVRPNAAYSAHDPDVNVFDLAEKNSGKQQDFVGHDPMPLGLEHIGFKVESVDKIKGEMDELVGVNPQMITRPLGYGEEGRARLELFKRCPLGCHHLTDIEGVYIDVAES